MNVSIVELSNDSWSIVVKFGKYTVTAFSEGFPSSEQLQDLMEDIKSRVARKL